MGLWYTEKHRLGFGITYKIKRTLADEQTEFQKLELVDTEAFGRMLLLDGLVMT
ncbi:MAG: spermidine synthase, partial [Firmicutes bacterium]|nr:spermidine synthase [Bacillota bacterium]